MSSPWRTNKQHEGGNNILECGTSLAESECTTTTLLPLTQSENEVDDNVLSPKENKDDTGTVIVEAFPTKENSIHALRQALSLDFIGSNQTLTSPFSSHLHQSQQQVPLVYCDSTASSRPLHSLETYLNTTCLPLYGNTHTHSSTTGSQSTAFVAEARQLVAEGVNAKMTGKAKTDVVLFVGQGATSAVALLVEILGLCSLGGGNNFKEEERPVVFVGPFEHHSNLIPWRESGCEVVFVPECPRTGDVDLQALEALLQDPQYGYTPPSTTPTPPRRLRIGTFTAASNLTGRTSNTHAITALLHLHHSLAIWDYATAAPYLPMDMNPPPPPVQTWPSVLQKYQSVIESQSSSFWFAKDALVCSPHKFPGGPGSPGVLVCKKALVNPSVAPRRSGGGTVFYTTHEHHRFLSNRVERYEGGTPNVVGVCKVGLVFAWKRRVERGFARCCAAAAAAAEKEEEKSVQEEREKGQMPSGRMEMLSPLARLEDETWQHVVSSLRKKAPNLIVLGTSLHRPTVSESNATNRGNWNLPIFSFLIRCGPRFLHYNYVCALLNDVFGIQSRGGCQCAGPYAQRLLGLTKTTTRVLSTCRDKTVSIHNQIPNDWNAKVEDALVSDKAELLCPGFTRVSLPYVCTEEEVEYVMEALAWVAEFGWMLLPQYGCNHRTGEWRHSSRQGRPLGKERRWLSHYLPPYEAKNAPPMDYKIDPRPRSVQMKEAFDHANSLLEVAKKEQLRQDASAAATAASSLMESREEDGSSWEELRWYVLPQECTVWLRRGGIPEEEGGELLGALRPPECFPKKEDRAMESLKAQEQEEIGTSNTDFAAATAVDSPKDDNTVNNAAGVEKENGNDSAISKMYFFREGEEGHSGEATRDEIREGYDDGELTEACQIFDAEKDRWMDIASFLSSSDSDKANHLDEKASAAVTEATTDEADSLDTSNRTSQVQTNAAVSRSGTKKSLRDQSVWGQGPSVGALSDALSKSDYFHEIHQDEGDPQETDTCTSNNAASCQTTDEFRTNAQVERLVLACSSPSFTPANTSSIMRKKAAHVKPPKKLMRTITQAMLQWDMLENGDRLLLGLSGGKDSLTLLHCLLEFQRKLPVQFEIEVCTVDPMTDSFDPSPLIPYVRDTLGLTYHYIRDDIVDRANTSGADGKVVSSLCSFCSRMKRGILYQCARTHGCNKLVLAQHLDDMAESFMMSVMHNGFVRTMKAHYKINAGDVAVIRPLAYCREGLMTEFALAAGLPVINENCPACFEEPKERARMKKLLSREEALYPNLYDNVRKALLPLMHEDATALMRCYTEEALEKTRKEQAKANSKGRKGGKNGNHNDTKGGFRKHAMENGTGGGKLANAHANIAEDGCQGGEDEGKTAPLSTESTRLSHEEKKSEGPMDATSKCHGGGGAPLKSLADATEEELITELARRRKERYRLYGAMKHDTGATKGSITGSDVSASGSCGLTRRGCSPCSGMEED